jgi:hypothetical protein
LIRSFNGGKTLALNIFRDMAGFQELEQIVRPTSFGTNPRHFKTTEGLAGNDRPGDGAVDVKITYFKLSSGTINVIWGTGIETPR